MVLLKRTFLKANSFFRYHGTAMFIYECTMVLPYGVVKVFYYKGNVIYQSTVALHI